MRSLVLGAAGGLLGGAVVGLVESTGLLAAQGAPDLLSPLYAVVLYGAAGLGLGLPGGLVAGVVARGREAARADGLAFAAGNLVAVDAIGAYVALYQLNKVLFAEAGLPLAAKAGLGVAVLVYAALALLVGARLVAGPLAVLRRPGGALAAYGGLLAVTGVAAALPFGDDPRAGFAHGKGVPPTLADKPDVLVITVDTLRADHLGAYGMSGATPALDALAADGVVFEQAFAQASWTRSSFASLWTSRLPTSHNADTKGAMLPAEAQLLSEVLQQGGVTTGMLANNVNVSSTFGFDQGYDSFVYESPDYAFGATESVFGLTLYKVVHKLNERLSGGARRVESFYQPADVVLADAKAFLEANEGARTFLGVHLMEPHDPYFEHPYLDGSGADELNGKAYGRAEHEHPDPADAELLKRLYLDEVKHLDRKLAPFLDWLKSTGRYDRTLIVVTADHGEEFGEHGGFWHGTTLYDEQIHVPLIVKLPKQELAGVRVPWQVRSLDVAPTITAAMGLPNGERWEGSDLLVDVRAQVDEATAQAAALTQERAEAQQVLEQLKGAVGSDGLQPGTGADPDEQVALREQQVLVEELATAPDPCDRYRQPRERLVVSEEDFEGNRLSAVRAGGFKRIVANAGNPRGLPEAQLFDVVEDPTEAKDLAGSDDERCGQRLAELPQALQTKLDAVLAASESGQLTEQKAAEGEGDVCQLCALGYKHGPECAKCN